MFAYLMIGIELAVIYAVFWYVFLREPKSNSNKDGHQGSQINDSGFTVYGANKASSAAQSSYCNGHQLNKDYASRSQTTPPELSRIPRHEFGAECSCSLVSSRKRGKRLRLAWLPADTLPPGSSTVERVCHYLGRKLIQFSVKAH